MNVDVHCCEDSREPPGAIASLWGQVLLEVRGHRWGGLFLLQELEKPAALPHCREVMRMTHTPGSLSRQPRSSAWTRASLTAPHARAGGPQIPTPPSHRPPPRTQICEWPSRLPTASCRTETALPGQAPSLPAAPHLTPQTGPSGARPSSALASPILTTHSGGICL